MTNGQHPAGWDDIGKEARIADTSTDRILVLTTRSVHIQFFRHEDKVNLRFIRFDPDGSRAPDREADWNACELGIAMNQSGYCTSIDASFVNAELADTGVKDRFARKGDHLVIHCPDPTGRGPIRYSFFLYQSIKDRFSAFLND